MFQGNDGKGENWGGIIVYEATLSKHYKNIFYIWICDTKNRGKWILKYQAPCVIGGEIQISYIFVFQNKDFISSDASNWDIFDMLAHDLLGHKWQMTSYRIYEN